MIWKTSSIWLVYACMLAGMAVGSKLAGMYAFFVPALLIPPLTLRYKGLPGVPGSPVRLSLLSAGVISPVDTRY